MKILIQYGMHPVHYQMNLGCFGVLSQATKNKTYTPKNICSSASKDCSHGEYLAQFYVVVRVRIVSTESIQPSFMLREQEGGGVEYNENNFKKNN